jgi:hypothetical protein
MCTAQKSQAIHHSPQPKYSVIAELPVEGRTPMQTVRQSTQIRDKSRRWRGKTVSIRTFGRKLPIFGRAAPNGIQSSKQPEANASLCFRRLASALPSNRTLLMHRNKKFDFHTRYLTKIGVHATRRLSKFQPVQERRGAI